MALNNTKKSSLNTSPSSKKNYGKIVLKKNFDANIMVYDTKKRSTITDNVIVK